MGTVARLLEDERVLGSLLLLPTVVLLGLFIAYPFVKGVWLSLTSATVGDHGQFVGLGNYVKIWNDSIFRTAVYNTFLYTGVTTVFKLTLGLWLALLLNHAMPFKAFIRAIVLLPYIVPTVLSAIAFWWIYDPQFSIISWSLHKMGLIEQFIDFLGVPWHARWSLIVANVWRGIPFVAICLLAGLQTISPDLYEAAAIDGASVTQRFLYVTLPVIKQVLIIVTMFSVIFTFGDFQLIYALTHGGPANATHVFSTWSFDIGMSAGQLGMGAAVALAILPALAVLIVGLTIYLRRE